MNTEQCLWFVYNYYDNHPYHAENDTKKHFSKIACLHYEVILAPRPMGTLNNMLVLEINS